MFWKFMNFKDSLQIRFKLKNGFKIYNTFSFSPCSSSYHIQWWKGQCLQDAGAGDAVSVATGTGQQCWQSLGQQKDSLKQKMEPLMDKLENCGSDLKTNVGKDLQNCVKALRKAMKG